MPHHEPTDLAGLASLLGRKVRARRRDLGLSQEALAHSVFMDRRSLQNIEYGRASTPNPDGSYGPGNPKLDTLLRLSVELDVDLAYLVDPTRGVETIGLS